MYYNLSDSDPVAQPSKTVCYKTSLPLPDLYRLCTTTRSRDFTTLQLHQSTGCVLLVLDTSLLCVLPPRVYRLGNVKAISLNL